MQVKDQERTGPHRIDRPTVAVVRTKLHLAEFLAVTFVLVGTATLLLSAGADLPWRAYNAGIACLLAAVVCAGVAATLDGQITSTAIIARQVGDLDRQVGDLDHRFRLAEDRMIDRIGGIDRKENRVLHEMTGIADVIGDQLEQRRRN